MSEDIDIKNLPIRIYTLYTRGFACMRGHFWEKSVIVFTNVQFVFSLAL